MTPLARSRLFQRGVAAVETALLLVPLVILMLGIAELGRAFYQYNTIVKATRDGARHLSMMAQGTGHETARCLVVTGRPAPCGEYPPLVDGLNEANVIITNATVTAEGGAPVMNLVTVTVTGYRSVNFVPASLLFSLPFFNFEGISTTMRQAS